MDADGPRVEAGLHGDPEDAHVALLVVLQQLALVDGAHAQLALHSADERRPLEEGAFQLLQFLKKRHFLSQF